MLILAAIYMFATKPCHQPGRVANLHTNPKPLASELAWKLTDVEG